MWSQVYDPFSSMTVSTAVAALPVVVLLGSIAVFEVRAHLAALLGLGTALAIAILAYGMPAPMAGLAAVYGAAFGLLPIGWIILNVIFLYQLASERGDFAVLQRSIISVSDDRRLQVLFIAFCLGAFFEGAAGFGTPVAVTAAILMGLGFRPLAASGLSLIANTAPVAFGALGTPIIALSAVTGSRPARTQRHGRPPAAVLLGARAVLARRRLRRVCAARWRSGRPSSSPAWRSRCRSISSRTSMGRGWSTSSPPLSSMLCLALFLRVWRPANPMTTMPDGHAAEPTSAVAAQQTAPNSFAAIRRAWTPWLILCAFVFVWGTPQVRAALDGLWVAKIPVAGLHELVQKVPPVVAQPSIEAAIYNFNILSATGTGILLAALVSGLFLGYGARDLVRTYARTLHLVRYSLLTIACMLAIGFVTRYSGADATLGLALANTGWLYPLFGTYIGWLGVALTGSDTSSNVLFGGLQRVTAEQLGLNPVLMAAANSSGGVMGKMIDAQSIVVASTATRWYGHEGSILRFVFFHSVALATLVGILVMGQAYVWPLTLLAPR